MASHQFTVGTKSQKRTCTATATLLVGIEEASIATSATIGKDIKVSWDRMLHAEHSPVRTVTYRIRLDNIPSFVSTHLVRHKIGVEHFVQSLREDRGGKGDEDRWSPVCHTMTANAQALMNMARRRLCRKASQETQDAMTAIRLAVHDIDAVLAQHLVPMCEYRGNTCHEFSSCGHRPHYTKPRK